MEISSGFSRRTINNSFPQGTGLMVSYDSWEEGNKSMSVAEGECHFALVVFLLLFFTPVFSGEWDLVSHQNLTASKIHGLKSSAVIANVKSNL